MGVEAGDPLVENITFRGFMSFPYDFDGVPQTCCSSALARRTEQRPKRSSKTSRRQRE